MSLFPAYNKTRNTSDGAGTSGIGKSSEGGAEYTNWLKNSSFSDISLPQFSTVSSHGQENKIISLDEDWTSNDYRMNLKYEKKLGKQTREKIVYVANVSNVYHEDKTSNALNCNFGTLPTRARPEYVYRPRYLGCSPYAFELAKKEIIKRYYTMDPDLLGELRITYSGLKKGNFKTSDGYEKNVLCITNQTLDLDQDEKEHKSLTREFNKALTDSPSDIELWLRYIEFQDIIHSFEKFFNANERDLNKKKLSIVDKGTMINPQAIELQRKKFHLLGELYPADELLTHMKNLLLKDTGNVFYWQAYIMVVQSSIAMCTVPKILNMYTECFDALRIWSLKNQRTYNQRILEMLFQYLIFLRQAGLWEEMWETLRLNLNLNICPTLRPEVSIKENELINFEEVILTSGLPLNQLWLRIELLRENCHWIRVDRDDLELIGDPDRYTLRANVGDFVHPTTRDSDMRLAIYALLALKVPLLPTYDSILKDLGLDKCSWTIDSIESLLPMLYPTVGELAGYKERKSLLEGLVAGGLTSGPQYIRYHPAQEPYIDFIRGVFSAIAESLSPVRKTSLYVWWMRFERMLLYVSKDEAKSDSRRKKLAQILKDFLRKEENRYNLHFYREWALIQREMGSFDSCTNILEKVIEDASIETEDDRTALISLQRTLLEVLLSLKNYDEQEHNSRVKKVLCQIVPSEKRRYDLELAEAYLRERLEEYLQQTHLPKTENMDTYFLPNPVCDTMACYAYLLYVDNRNVSEILKWFEECFRYAKDNNYLQERFYVNEIVVLQTLNERFCAVNKIFVDKLNDALKLYPDNFYLLSVLAGIEMQSPTWKLTTRIKIDRPWHALAFCMAGRVRINSFMKGYVTDAATASINKLINFHHRLARVPEMRNCPLSWRLLMLLLREQNLSEKRGERTYHESVAQCPWARSIYIDAAEVAPQLLTQIQNVIRDKELRMHISPEELNILRGS